MEVFGSTKQSYLFQHLPRAKINWTLLTLRKLEGYAIPKINMLRNLMLFENEVKAAVHLISTVQQPEPRFTTA